MLSKKVGDFVSNNADKKEITQQDMAIINLTNQYVLSMKNLAMHN